MRVGFLNNQIDGRGTGNAVFNYAHYNEEILGNKSKILTYVGSPHSQEAVDKFAARFGDIYNYESDNLRDVDLIYHIKSGDNDSTYTHGLPYVVHAVFHGSEPHGNRYAAISEWMGTRDKIPFVPHIVNPLQRVPDMRPLFGIPDDATVIGRIGGADSFDIPFVWEVIEEAVHLRPDLWFLFANTNHRSPKLLHGRVKYFPFTIHELTKYSFIRSCDAMLHARQRGETFGISVGEFSACGKHIFTYKNSPEKAHIYELRGTAKTYVDKDDLLSQILSYERRPAHQFYNYVPDNVMPIFKEVFLDGHTGLEVLPL